jgi:phage-related protein
MRTVDAAFTTEKNKASNQPIFLYTIYDYDGSSTNLYFAEYDTDIKYPAITGITYIKYPITHDYVSENTSGEIDSVKVRISNVSREIQAYLETYDLRGKKVVIKIVFANQLADADVYLNDTYYIDSYTADQQVIEFTLSGKMEVWGH